MEKGNFWVVITLSFMSFAIGVAEFAPMGILLDMARDFNRPIHDMKEVASLYALGAAIGTPIVIYFIAGLSRNKQITIILLVFAICNLFIAITTSYSLLILFRFFSGIMHGVYVTVAILLVTTITSEKNKAFAGALIVSGISLALVFGIPLSTLISNFFSWHLIFFGTMALALLVMIAAFFVIPKLPNATKPKLIEQFYILKIVPLIKSYLINIFTYAGIFSFVAYMSKTLQYHHLNVSATSIAFLAYGIACVVGNIFGGKLASKIGAMKSLTIMVCAQLVFFGLFFFINDSIIIISLNLLLMGFCAFGVVGPAQALVIQNATIYIPHAKDSALGLHVSSIQVGIAVGAIMGAFTIANLGIQYTPVTSAILFLVSFLLVISMQSNKLLKQIF